MQLRYPADRHRALGRTYPRLKKRMKTIRPYLSTFMAGMLLFFLLKPFIQTHAQLKDVVSIQIQWHWLLYSFLFLLIHRCAYLYPFAKFLSRIAQKHVPFQNAFTLFHLANITRYLPGRIWGVVRLLSLSKQFGLSKVAIGGSLTLHVGIETALGGFIGFSLIFSEHIQDTAQGILAKTSAISIVFFTFVVIGIMACILFLIPTVLTHTQRFLKVFHDTGKTLFQKPFWIQGFNIIAIHILLWICQGLAFYLFVRSLVLVPFSQVGVLIACYAFAWFCGFLSFLTPGGLGIREGLLAVLLANYMPGPEAALVALICRVWMLSAEMILAGVAFYLSWRAKPRTSTF